MHRSTDTKELIDPACLAAGHIPSDFPLHGGRLVFLWQTPNKSTIEYLRRVAPDIPIIVGRFEAEAAIVQEKIPYWTPADFFPIRVLVDFELAAFEARAAYRGPAMPTYLGMPLVDGDLPRIRAYRELLACAATLLSVRQAAPNVQVVTDWMGGQLAAAIGLRVRRLWRNDLADRNWPPRRWLRERLSPAARGGRSCATAVSAVTDGRLGTDVLIMLGGWVEQRLLDSFPIEALVDEGHRCLLLVHKSSPALDDLVRRTKVGCVQIDYPEPVGDAAPLTRDVAHWCAAAVDEGYFSPLRGPLAHCVNRLIGWPRWAPKLVAMHRLLTDWLKRERPRLLLAPAEKDWGPYCAHHAAKSLGIPSVGIKHASWLVGSDLDRLEDGLYFPTAARHILAYTPADAESSVDGGTLVWCGNPRVAKPPMPSGPSPEGVRILIGARGMGPGRTMYLHRCVVSWNIRLIEGLLARLGDRVRVRLHPWDSVEHYPRDFLPVFLPPGQKLEEQLAEYDAVATTYSTISLDVAAAGRPQFLWDHERLRLEQSEIAQFGGVICSHDLNQLVAAAQRFVEDADHRAALRNQAERFPEYLRRSLPDPRLSTSANIVHWLGAYMNDLFFDKKIHSRGDAKIAEIKAYISLILCVLCASA